MQKILQTLELGVTEMECDCVDHSYRTPAVHWKKGAAQISLLNWIL
jgi:hypothetical protein